MGGRTESRAMACGDAVHCAAAREDKLAYADAIACADATADSTGHARRRRPCTSAVHASAKAMHNRKACIGGGLAPAQGGHRRGAWHRCRPCIGVRRGIGAKHGRRRKRCIGSHTLAQGMHRRKAWQEPHSAWRRWGGSAQHMEWAPGMASAHAMHRRKAWQAPHRARRRCSAWQASAHEVAAAQCMACGAGDGIGAGHGIGIVHEGARSMPSTQAILGSAHNMALGERSGICVQVGPLRTRFTAGCGLGCGWVGRGEHGWGGGGGMGGDGRRVEGPGWWGGGGRGRGVTEKGGGRARSRRDARLARPSVVCVRPVVGWVQPNRGWSRPPSGRDQLILDLVRRSEGRVQPRSGLCSTKARLCSTNLLLGSRTFGGGFNRVPVGVDQIKADSGIAGDKVGITFDQVWAGCDQKLVVVPSAWPMVGICTPSACPMMACSPEATND